ncbi:hypothetical protein EAS56_37905 [Bradyrhizobium guangzhouense]|uniref:Uncharacterized protein n=1 Tax=Bradyrhizobium guangzhouense TaxID=1325095 RepID=A0ABY0DWG7_9BRAD|nr:hypothetical protein [Bradyrhizobium guangzhouense]RXH03657.1 hypothetical protein EAS56_37905 [Bradyrhizobium guangzhouense]
MDNEIAEVAVKLLLVEMQNKLREAEQIAKTAKACADAGSIPEAIRMDLDKYIYDADRLHDAVTLLGRLAAD